MLLEIFLMHIWIYTARKIKILPLVWNFKVILVIILYHILSNLNRFKVDAFGEYMKEVLVHAIFHFWIHTKKLQSWILGHTLIIRRSINWIYDII